MRPFSILFLKAKNNNNTRTYKACMVEEIEIEVQAVTRWREGHLVFIDPFKQVGFKANFKCGKER